MPTVVTFIVVLSVLVLVHEAGHYLAARILGIKVEEFAFGLPLTRAIVSIKRGETVYSVYPLLFGGFVRLYGEESEVGKHTSKKDAGRDFWSRGKRHRMMVIVAGVVMNVLLALVIFVGVYGKVGVPIKSEDKVTVMSVEYKSPADEGGLKENDRIVAVEDEKVSTNDDFTKLMRSWGGRGVYLTVESGKGTIMFEGVTSSHTDVRQVYVVPRANPPEGQGPLGIVVSQIPYVETETCVLLSPTCSLKAVTAGLKTTAIWIGRVVDGLKMIGTSLIAGKVPEGVSGPVGIYQLTGVVASEGWVPTMELIAILSVNLAVFNILPIPALDGGRLFFILLEGLRRKRFSAEFEQRVNQLGMVALLLLLGAITLSDVIRLGWWPK